MTNFNYYDRFNFPLIEDQLLSMALEQGVGADACTDCGECEPRCPYHLPTVAKLRHAHYKLTAEPRS